MTSFTDTRRSLHAVAEQVVSAALHQATGHIGLRPTPGGFGTPVFDERKIRVEGLDIVVSEAGASRRTPLTTLREAADFVGITPGAPDLYPAATSVDLDQPLVLDAEATARIHGWFDTTGRALGSLAARFGGASPPVAQLWPEHFDLAVALNEVNYGGSPGDEDHPAPYAYVGPWDRSCLHDRYWNEPFGASRPAGSVAELLAFFEEGLLLCVNAA